MKLFGFLELKEGNHLDIFSVRIFSFIIYVLKSLITIIILLVLTFIRIIDFVSVFLALVLTILGVSSIKH